MTEVVINAKEMRDLAVAVKIAGKASEKAFYDGLKIGGEIVAVRARQKANAFTRKGSGTKRIADSIVVRRRGTRVRIQAGGGSAPEAAPLEASGLGGTFRHPVFGNRDVWVSQPAHPFLYPAAIEAEPAVVDAVNRAVDAAFQALGF